jgi:hypothetical protein
MLLMRAFRRAWKALLKQERVSAQNVERLPVVLMEAIIQGIQSGERQARNLAAAAMARTTRYEREGQEDSLALH